MRILFNLLTTIEIPDADIFPPREEAEKELVEFFASEGMIAHGLEITNYGVPADEQDGQVMDIGRARAIFDNLNDCNQPMEVKGLAIRKVIDMETHNSITKNQMLKAMNWMWEQIFKLKQEGE